MTILIRYFGKMSGGNSLPNAPDLMTILLAGVGGAIAIASVAMLTDMTGTTFLMAPFGASCFLAFAAPDSPLAQPRNIIFGHLISTAVGLVALSVIGPGWMGMAVAVGLAIILMQMTGTGHAPAGADPLVVMVVAPGWEFLMFPVLTGAIMIVLVALVFNNLRSDVQYPRYW